MSSPLFDTLFRPTTASSALASAAPVRVTGTRTRAGNAMSRTRTALLAGAATSVEANGTRIAMAQVAAAAGVAKATLYNHFRTRDAVLTAVLLDQVETLIRAAEGKPLERALADTAVAISRNPVRRGLSRIEPAVLAQVGRIDLAAEGWRLARESVDGLLTATSLGGTDLVLRWLASFIISPADPMSIASDVAALVAGLTSVHSLPHPAAG